MDKRLIMEAAVNVRLSLCATNAFVLSLIMEMDIGVSEAKIREMRAQIEADYKKDIAMLDWMLARFCPPKGARVSDTQPTLGSNLSHPFSEDSHGGRAVDLAQPAVESPKTLEEMCEQIMTRGSFPSPWTAPTIYRMLGGRYPFRQQQNGAINSVLFALKAMAKKGMVSEVKGRGRRASEFTWIPKAGDPRYAHITEKEAAYK